MNDRLMSPTDLIEVTRKTRYTTQAAWFKRRFGIAVTQRDDGSIVLAWDTFLALDAKKAGVAVGTAAPSDFEICYD